MNVMEDLIYFEQRILNRQLELERAKASNQQLEELVVARTRMETLLNKVVEYKQTLVEIYNKVIVENNHFRNRRIEHLNDAITNSVAEVFPDDFFTAKVNCDFSRKNVVSLTLQDVEGHELKPSISSGKLLQYLISFSAVCGITKSLGCNSLFIDEAFGVASIEKLGIVGSAIKKKIENGMQVILVSQNPAIYNDLPRHEILLSYDKKAKKVILVNEIDY